ncbi:MAG: preprotein translocase subunit YajC [Phycisphaerales bacterium]|nr:preprotein translocase subunit YajC [Phycisphaerales bacterium]
MPIPSPFWNLPLGQVPLPDETGKPAVPAPAAAPSAPANEQHAQVTASTEGTKTSTGQSSEPTTLPQQEQRKPSPFDSFILPLVIGGFILIYIMMSRGQRKEEKRRKQLIAEIKKGDRVLTIGGLVARVVSVENDEVVLKVDESANVKATYKKSSIHRVLLPEDEKTTK